MRRRQQEQRRPPARRPRITYEKIVVLKIVPHLPVEKKTFETWSASNAPSTYRQVVTIAGGPRFEIGASSAHGKVLGEEQANYLYDASTNTIYRTGFLIPPLTQPPTREQRFKLLLATRGVRLAGTRTYRGRTVYVLDAQGSPGIKVTIYVDTRTHEPIMEDETGPDLRVIQHTLAFKVFPLQRPTSHLPACRRRTRTRTWSSMRRRTSSRSTARQPSPPETTASYKPTRRIEREAQLHFTGARLDGFPALRQSEDASPGRAILSQTLLLQPACNRTRHNGTSRNVTNHSFVALSSGSGTTRQY